jgi:hypothetical protein
VTRRAVALAALVLVVSNCASDDGAGGSSVSSAAASTVAPSIIPPASTVTDTAASTAPDTDAATTVSASPDSSAAETTTTLADDGVIDVPADHDTIQAAVDAAQPGDLVLIAPGVYEEAVAVTTDDLTIRGVDRNDVILDGGFELDHGFFVLGANGVAIENLTTRNFTRNGIYFTEVDRYRASYVTAYRNGDYGIYAYDSTNGVFEHSYASGSPDAGYYIGGCYPCDALIDDVISEYNGLGYSGTNAGGNLVIQRSTFRYNRAGIVPNTGTYEPCYPQRDSVIVGNLVHSNNQADTPAIDVAILAMGNGILVAGGNRNTIIRNTVVDHDKLGIGLVPYPEEEPVDAQPSEADWDLPCPQQYEPADPSVVPDSILWDSMQNVVKENVLADNREGDLVVASVGVDISTFGNCFLKNEHTTTHPTFLEALAPCERTGTGDWTADAYNIAEWLNEENPPSGDYRTASPVPPDQPNMPDAETAPARPAEIVPEMTDFTGIDWPPLPEV